MHESVASPSLTVWFRCVIASVLLSAFFVAWRLAIRLLPEDHPARIFVVGLNARDRIRTTSRAARVTPCGKRIGAVTMWAWTGVALSSVALFVSELAGTTTILWEGYLPGV